MSTGDDVLNAKSVEALLFVSMEDNALHAKIVEVLLFVNMGENALDAKSAEVLQYPAAALVHGGDRSAPFS